MTMERNMFFELHNQKGENIPIAENEYDACIFVFDSGMNGLRESISSLVQTLPRKFEEKIIVCEYMTDENKIVVNSRPHIKLKTIGRNMVHYIQVSCREKSQFCKIFVYLIAILARDVHVPFNFVFKVNI